MSNYFSCLATRSGLLNSPQSATSAIVSSLQKGHRASPQHLEIQTEHATVETTEAAKSDIQPITHVSVPSIQHGHRASPQHLEIQAEHATIEATEAVKSDIQPITHISSHMKSAQPRTTSIHREGKTGIHDSDAMFGHSSRPDIQDPIEKGQMRCIERNKVVVAERFDRDSAGLALPIAESQQAGEGSQPSVPASDSSSPVFQSNAIQAELSGNIDEGRGLLHHDVVRPIAMKADNILPSKHEGSHENRTKTVQAEQSDSDPLMRVLEAQKSSRNDSKPSRQHEQTIAEQQFREQSAQPSQVNIQSITLEVHQAEPVRTPAPATAPRHHAPAPKQNTPSQTRLSRYYLKGW